MNTDPRMPASTGWKSNTDEAELAAWLRSGRHAVLLTHAKPDGDAAGSALALARALRLVGVNPEVWFVGPVPRWVGEITGDTPFRMFQPGSNIAGTDSQGASPPDPDRVVILDTGSWSQLSEARVWLTPRSNNAAIVDHHLHGDPDVASRRLIRSELAATAEVLAPVCRELLRRGSTALPLEIAEPLYLGLGTDTGWFRLSNVRPGTMRLAADLLEAGVDHTRLYAMIEQRDGAPRWKLLGKALSSLELHDGGRIALMTLRSADFDDCGADRNDTGGFADMVLSIETVQVSVVLTEGESSPGKPGAPITKVSMRSKPGPHAIDVNKATNALGGGGHARAAGARMDGVPLAEARGRVLAVLAPPPE